MAVAGPAAHHGGTAARRRGGHPGGRERPRLHRQLVRSAHDRAHDRHRHRRLDGDGPLAAMTISTAAAPGIARGGGTPPAAPGAGTGTAVGTGSTREARRWLAAQGRPGRHFFLAAGLADVAATAGTVIFSWYVA